MLRRKPFLCPAARISQLFEIRWTVNRTHRYFSWLRSPESRENENEIADWVKGSLQEPIPPQHFQERLPVNNNTGLTPRPLDIASKIISDDEYLRDWHSRFAQANLGAVRLVIEGIRSKTMLFSLPHLVVLLRSLHSIKRHYEIHEIYCALEHCAPFIKDRNCDASIRQEFLNIVLQAEDVLGNYELCEKLFSDYIKSPRLESSSISIGLKSFLRNDNLQLAKQFFMQVLENPETFPITKREFQMFCHELGQFQDIDSMLFVFKLWARKKCLGDANTMRCDPDYDTLSLFHRLFIQLGDKKGLDEFLKHEVVRRSGYQTDINFQITEFCQELIQSKKNISAKSSTTEKIDEFLTMLDQRPGDRRRFYLSLLNALVMGDDFSSIRHVIGRVQHDKAVPLDGSFHLVIAKFFVRNGMLNHMIQYYSDVVLNQAAGRIRLKVSHIEQLWDCALQAYPTLTREITNDLKILLSKQQYARVIPSLHQVIKQAARVRTRKIKGGEEYFKSSLSQVDYERLRRLERYIASHDIGSATDTALESLKRGVKPGYKFYLCAIRTCLSSSLPNLAKTFNDMLLKHYSVSLKLSIVWLRYDVASKYKSITSNSEMLPFREVPLLQARLSEFVRLHQEALNFQNYLQLSQISMLIRDYSQASELIKRAASVMDRQSRQQWLMYYMTALKTATRLYKPDEFLALLQAWNQNSRAKLITQGCLRQIKVFCKLFEKRLDRLSSPDDVLLIEISKEIDLLVEKYVALKFEGLNESLKLCTLLKRWLTLEKKELSRIERKRRKALAAIAYSDKA